MNSPQFVADHHFPGPPARRRPTVHTRPVYTGALAPAVYRVDGLSKSRWKSVWRQILVHRRFCLTGPPPTDDTQTVTLLFEAPDAGPPLGLVGQLTDHDGPPFQVVTARPSLSWRIAAVDLGRRLPDGAQSWSIETIDAPTPRADLRRRRLRLRPDLAGPAPSIAPFSQLVTGLRARFWTLDDLASSTDISSKAVAKFVGALDAAGLIIDAPTALESNADPFEFFGLHWSAHDPLIRRTYRRLRRSTSHNKRLEQAFAHLCRPDRRRRIRRHRLPAAVITEVADYFRDQLHPLSAPPPDGEAIDLCRRILELDPWDTDIKDELRRQLCYHNQR